MTGRFFAWLKHPILKHQKLCSYILRYVLLADLMLLFHQCRLLPTFYAVRCSGKQTITNNKCQQLRLFQIWRLRNFMLYSIRVNRSITITSLVVNLCDKRTLSRPPCHSASHLSDFELKLMEI